jgi:hypothetical protein
MKMKPQRRTYFDDIVFVVERKYWDIPVTLEPNDDPLVEEDVELGLKEFDDVDSEDDEGHE